MKIRKNRGLPPMSRTEKSVKNLTYAIAGQSVGLLISFVSRKIFVQYLSAEYLGINGLFTNILAILSLAELGVGAAIVYSLYKPLAEGDREKVKSLMALFKRAYTVIGCAIAVCGVALTPFLDIFVSEMPDISHIELIYVLFVANSAISYFFTYKRSLIIADQNRYVATFYRYAMYLCLNVAQIIVLILTRNFILYLCLQVFSTLLENILISVKADKLYPYLRDKNIALLEKDDKDKISKNIRAMVAHKIGGVVVNGTDNLLLSRLVSVVAVGLYSNYYLITSALNSVIGLLSESITASLGHLGATEDEEKNHSIFNILNFALFWIYGFSAICLFVLFNPFIELWLGDSFLFERGLVALIVFNYYITGMRKSVLVYRDALGLYWFDRYKPIFESLINLAVSIWLGLKMGATGIFIGTAVSTITTCFWVEPYMLFRHGFHKSVFSYFLRYGVYTAICVAAGAATYWLTTLVTVGGLWGFVLMAVICAIVPNTVFILVFHRTGEFKYLRGVLMKLIRGRKA